MSPTISTVQHGKNYKKNLRHNRARKRRAQAARGLQWKIECGPDVRRTLRKTPRKALLKDTDARYIHPWVRDNPAYRLRDCVYPTASLLGLPKEIRQAILYMRYPLPEHDEPGRSYFAKGRRPGRWRTLCEKIGELCCVSPVLRVDMEYVGARWKEELLKEEEEKKKKMPKPELDWYSSIGTQYRSKRGPTKGKVVTVRRGKKHSKRSRPQKCWYCDGRHQKGGKYIVLQPRL
jgi:hypothetical protein